MNLENFLQTKKGTTLELGIFFAVSLSTLRVEIIIPVLIIVAIGSLKVRKLKYSEIGFIKTDFRLRKILQGAALAILYFILFHYIIDPLISKFTSGGTPAIFNIKGNPGELIFWLIISWTIAAVGEEIIFRGYLINRLTDLVGNSVRANIVIVFLAGTAFGFVHLYQGMHGAISASLFGIFQSAFYLTDRRKLVIPIISHGAFDSLGFIELFI
jgi:membrane protease YdiL (CAAX protease family)